MSGYSPRHAQGKYALGRRAARFGARHRNRVLVLLAVALGVASLPLTGASAGSSKSSTFTASISPTTVTANTSTPFMITVANSSTSSNAIGSIQIVVPTTNPVSVPALLNNNWTGTTSATCNSGSPANCGLPGTTLVQFNSPNGGTNKIAPGGSLIFPVTTNLTGCGVTTWQVAANSSAAWSNGSTFTPPSTFPTVAIALSAPYSLAYVSGSAPPQDVSAGVSFSTSVKLVDANGCPISGATVSLAAAWQATSTNVPFASGNISAQTDSTGRATFANLSVDEAWTLFTTAAASFSVTATDVTDNVSASAPMQVDPTAAAKLVLTGPSAHVLAGGNFAISGSLIDQYKNPIDLTATAPTISLSGPSGLSMTQPALLTGPPNSTGTTFSVTAPTTPGSYTYTLTSGSLSGSVTVVVDPGAPDHLQITSVSTDPNTANYGLLQPNSGFFVTVTAYDKWGNVTADGGNTVTLSTSGGVPAGGTLSGSTSSAFVSGATSLTIGPVSYSIVAGGITLSASSSLPTVSTTIDMNQYVSSFQIGNKKSYTLTLNGCSVSTTTPVCSTLVLPSGAQPSSNGGANVFLGEAPCNAGSQPGLTCLSGSANTTPVVSALASLAGLTSPTNPATMILTCDKSLCGGSGATSFNILFQPTGDTTYYSAPPCPSKGQLGTGQAFCQDYTQDHRTGAGNLVAYLLFLDDSKISFG